MSEAVIKGVVREAGRKGPARKLRREGMTPGVVYGVGGTLNVALPTKALLKMLDDRAAARRVISATFEGDGKERKVLIKRLDVHPITDVLTHIDLWEVALDKPVKVKVPLNLSGVPIGVREQGGVLLIARNNVNIKVLPADIPNSFDIDLTNLNAGETLSVKDLPTDVSYEPLEDQELTLVTVALLKKQPGEDGEEGAEVEAESTEPTS